MTYFPPPSGDPSPFEGEPFTPLSRPDRARRPGRRPRGEPRRRSAWRGLVAAVWPAPLLGGGVAFATVKATEADTPKTVVVAAPAAETSSSSATSTPAATSKHPLSRRRRRAARSTSRPCSPRSSPSVVAIELGHAATRHLRAGGRLRLSSSPTTATSSPTTTSSRAPTPSGEDVRRHAARRHPGRQRATHDIAVVQDAGRHHGAHAGGAGRHHQPARRRPRAWPSATPSTSATAPTVTQGIVSAKGRTIRHPRNGAPSARGPHPDRRRDQPGQLGWPARERRRRGRRHQHRRCAPTPRTSASPSTSTA